MLVPLATPLLEGVLGVPSPEMKKSKSDAKKVRRGESQTERKSDGEKVRPGESQTGRKSDYEQFSDARMET